MTSRGIVTGLGRGIVGARRRGLSAAAASVQKSASHSPLTTVSTLPNGMRVATENTNLPTATIGVFIDAGSRYENDANNGTAHFLEHMAFKGTSRRSRHDLELEVENIGAHLNAYTSREQTVYYAKCFSHHLERSADILSDILLHSQLHERDISAERSVILREADEVAQDLREVVFDELHEAAFAGTPLAYTILGPAQNIKTISRNDLSTYIKTHYKARRMVLAASGGVDHSHVVALAEKYFGQLPSGSGEDYLIAGKYKACETKRPVPEMHDVYGAICVEGLSWTHEHNLTMMVANTILGEWDRARGSNLSVPTKLQVAAMQTEGVNSFQAFNTCYKDTGLIGVYYVAKEDAARKLLDAIVESWRWLAYEVDKDTVERAKRTLLTNLILMLDGSTPVTEDMGRQLLCYGRRIPLEELKLRVDAITVDVLREVCRERLLNCKLATTVVGRVQAVPSNAELEAALRK